MGDCYARFCEGRGVKSPLPPGLLGDALSGLPERLCQVLDLHPVELFAAPFRVAQRRAIPAPEVAADAQVLEAARWPPSPGRPMVGQPVRSAGPRWPTR